MTIEERLSSEFGLRQDYTKNIIELIDEGNTIPFIARYRKEMHGSCDDQVLRNFADRLKYLRNLDDEKAKVEKVITEQGKWTDELAKALEVSRQTIGSLENGRYNPSIILAFKIAKYFIMSIEEIFIYEEE